MKRGADAMDARAGGRGDRDGQRTWTRPDHKRARHAYQGRPRNGNGNCSTGATGATVRTLADEKETDPHRLAQRQKQIDYGKNTIGYDRYCAQVPRHQRRPGKHPMTPDKTKRMGKKVFDGIVRKWRQALHKYDPPELVEAIKTVEAENNVAEPTESSAKTDDADATAEKEAATAASTESDAKKAAGAVPTNSEAPPPSRSIYENFDEDSFDEEDSDDDLL